jgi:hypothetical protein
MSTLKADTIQNTSGGAVTLTKQEGAKLRCRFNGTGTAALETGDLNVSSLTDNGTGEFSLSITSAFNDGLYSVAGVAGEHGGSNAATWLGKRYDSPDYSTTSLDADIWNFQGSQYDAERVSVVVFGDLA